MTEEASFNQSYSLSFTHVTSSSRRLLDTVKRFHILVLSATECSVASADMKMGRLDDVNLLRFVITTV